MTGVMLNGKTELRVCNAPDKLDKSGYGKLGKVQLKGAASLERGADGTLTLAKEQQSICVVPSNLRFEGGNEFTPAELADQALLQGTVVSASDGQPSKIPDMNRGVRIVFVANADTELAEFLRAQRANAVPVWQNFLGAYPSSSHAAEARTSLAGLFEDSADKFFTQYQKGTGSDRWANLKQAQQFAEQANRVVENFAPARKSLGQIVTELDNYSASVRADLAAYRKAMQEQTAGHAYLAAGKRLCEQILDVDANYKPGIELQGDLVKEQSALDSALGKAEGLLANNRPDEALLELRAYRYAAADLPRVEAIVTAVYVFHFNRGKEAGAQAGWDKAVVEFRKALETRADSDEARAALKDAEIQLTNASNRAAANRAAEESKTYAEQKHYIEAYEVLATLPDPQRALVSDEIEALKANYVPAAVQRAQSLQEVHVPIRGRADEDYARQAYHLLARASLIVEEPSIRLKRDLLGDKISTYYAAQAKRYLEKPMASGVALGWSYLSEAQLYEPTLETVKDAMTRYEPAYKVRANLSIEVVIRDQTSRRENAGFAEQLTDAIDTDLENSGLPVRVVRPVAGAGPMVEPLFRLEGEINEYRKVRNPSLETVQSKYRAAVLPVKNEAWLKAQREYENAQQDVETAQHALNDALGRKKKKEITAAQAALADAQKKLGDLRTKLDATDQTRAQEVLEPYNYTKTTIDLSGVINVAFRVLDLNGTLIENTTPVKQESHKVYVVLDNVKPEDTEGVKGQSAPPDEGAFMTDLEIQARDALSKSIHERVQRLPGKILEKARKFAQQNDGDAAGEWYVIYLNATPETPSPERGEAIKFLRDRFNVSEPARQLPSIVLAQ
jgi:hypothetical protein